MAPSKKQTTEPGADPTSIKASIQTILQDLADIKSRLTKVDTLEEKLNKLQQTLEATSTENAALKEENAKLKKDINDNSILIKTLQASNEAVERHQRSWSVRIQNVPLTIAEERDMGLTMQKVHKLVFEPILQGAVSCGVVRQVPDFDQLLESAHVLPGKTGSSKPIIARFRTRFWKNLCFRFRKDHATRINKSPAGQKDGRPGRGEETNTTTSRYCFPFCDDLTKPAFSKLLEIQADPAVQSCWSINGSLRFKLKNSPSVRKVHSVFDTINDILK